ncbi:MAG: phosphonate metabolism protein PhnM [Spirochaetales bacterium]|nr:phosphonate metabolism protein PhnM [Spirochaetales bacterium]
MRKHIFNANIIGPDKVLFNAQLCISNGRLVKILPMEEAVPSGFAGPGTEQINAENDLLAPGFIDIHSDYIEHMAAPRPSCLIDFRTAIRESERELLAHGITTMFHSLSFYKSTEFPDKIIRAPEHTRRLIEEIGNSAGSESLINNCFHARFEIDSLDRVPELEMYIKNGMVHLLSFMDHTPGQGQYRDLEIFRKTLKGYKDVSDAEIDVMIDQSRKKEKLTLSAIKALAGLAGDAGIAVASHDDDSPEKVELNRQLGFTISEFPITMQAAARAKELGLFTVAGAPNVMLGGSHSGNISAADAIQAGLIDVLCSDYYPASLLHAVFQLYRENDLDLSQAFRLVTLHPAMAVNMDRDRGSLEEGKIADILLIRHSDDGFPYVRKAFIGGCEKLNMAYKGQR